VLSLNSYCTGLILICLDNTTMYGPYFGEGARLLYARSRGRVVRCAGRPVTHLGTAAGETLAGARGADVIRLGPGADTALGRAGRDRLCGSGGRDALRGGPGFDVCVGGPGRDTARGCERRLGIP
jgi:Ca2+-binding RTX toxin-like protein